MTVPIHGTSNLRLQVETAPPAIRNVFPDPSGALGTWAFGLSPITDGTGVLTSDGTRYTTGTTSSAPTGTRAILSGPKYMRVSAGESVRVRYRQHSATSGVTLWIRTTFYNASSVAIGSSSYVAPTLNGEIASVPTLTAPSGTVSAQTQAATSLSGFAAPSSGAQVVFSEFTVAVAATSAELSAVPGLIDPLPWSGNLIGPTHHIEIDRKEFDTGFLSAVLLDPNLDPATSSAIAPGRRVRVQALVGSTWETLFFGRLRDADVAYVEGRNGIGVASRIYLEAVDSLAELTSARDTFWGGRVGLDMSSRYASQNVPFVVNGSSNVKVGAWNQILTNPEASPVDWIALNRDSERGYAWMSRDGRLIVRNAATMPTTPLVNFSDIRSAAATAEEYGAIDVGFSTSDVINTVTVTWLRPKGTDVEQITYGPYTDDSSIARYGARAKNFTIFGSSESPTTIEAFARAVISGQASPVRKAKSLTMPVRDSRSLGHAATLDLYDLVGVKRGSVLDSSYRITSIKHVIDTNHWSTSYGFDVTGAVAPPATQPAPASGTASDGTWITMTLQNSWVAFDARTPQYCREGGRVYFRGLMKSGAVGSVFTTMPAGYRPEFRVDSDHHFPVASNGAFGYVRVFGSNGQMDLPAGSNAWVDLSAVQYKVA